MLATIQQEAYSATIDALAVNPDDFWYAKGYVAALKTLLSRIEGIESDILNPRQVDDDE